MNGKNFRSITVLLRLALFLCFQRISKQYKLLCEYLLFNLMTSETCVTQMNVWEIFTASFRATSPTSFFGKIWLSLPFGQPPWSQENSSPLLLVLPDLNWFFIGYLYSNWLFISPAITCHTNCKFRYTTK